MPSGNPRIGTGIRLTLPPNQAHPRPRRRIPAHLVIDPESPGESHWNAFAGDVRHWLSPRAVKTEPLDIEPMEMRS